MHCGQRYSMLDIAMTFDAHSSKGSLILTVISKYLLEYFLKQLLLTYREVWE